MSFFTIFAFTTNHVAFPGAGAHAPHTTKKSSPNQGSNDKEGSAQPARTARKTPEILSPGYRKGRSDSAGEKKGLPHKNSEIGLNF